MSFKKAKIALVFDWMTTAGGAEKVNKVLHKMFPEADIFTSIYNKDKVKGFENAKIHTSFIQNLPFAKKKHQLYLSLMPYAYELFDLSKYDIVISSSHSCAKGIITKAETLHVCYCHTPMRYAWDNWHSYFQEYKMNGLIKKLAKKRIHKIRIWDKISADRVDHFIANSNTTKKRIEKYYKKPSTVIYPMISANKYKKSNNSPRGYYFAAGRLIPYKKFDLLVETFNKIGLPLKIAGTGIMEKELRAKANDNIEFLGYVSDPTLKKLYSECEAYLFPQLEDFGITPLEAMASGRPVIAYKKGGALDTITEETGLFFEEQNAKSLSNAIEQYQKEKNKFDSEKIIAHAKKFDTKEFEKKLLNYISNKWEKWN